MDFNGVIFLGIFWSFSTRYTKAHVMNSLCISSLVFRTLSKIFEELFRKNSQCFLQNAIMFSCIIKVTFDEQEMKKETL